MSGRNFMEMLKARWAEGKFVCVGLDPDFDKIPQHIREKHAGSDFVGKNTAVKEFLRAIITATDDLVCAYKPNAAFFEGLSEDGGSVLRDAIFNAKCLSRFDVPVIYDAKRADIGNTNRGYVASAFDVYGADAITVSPYFGKEASQPFLERTNKGIVVLCRTSNPGADEFQDLLVEQQGPLYRIVAQNVAKEWNSNGNCLLVVGATTPDELADVRGVVGDMPILIPGIGAQGGDLEASVRNGMNSKDEGFIINVSRSVLYASSGEDFAEAARAEVIRLNTVINGVLEAHR